MNRCQDCRKKYERDGNTDEQVLKWKTIEKDGPPEIGMRCVIRSKSSWLGLDIIRYGRGPDLNIDDFPWEGLTDIYGNDEIACYAEIE